MTNGYLRVAAASPLHKICNTAYNVAKIKEVAEVLNTRGVEVAVFPELSVTGYSCGDLLHNFTLLEAARTALGDLAQWSRGLDMDIVVGLPIAESGAVYNCAALIRRGDVEIVKKTYLPSYNEFYEKRWFQSASPDAAPAVFESHGARIAIEICEDLWAPIPPSSHSAMRGAEVILNLSASNDLIGKHRYLVDLIRQQSGRCLCGYVYASAGWGESTTDTVFLPKTIIAESGALLAENDRYDYAADNFVIADLDIEVLRRDRMHNTTFADCARRSGDEPTSALPMTAGEINPDVLPEYRTISPTPFIPGNADDMAARCREITAIQECGLATRLDTVGSNRIVVGVSGGLDSTLALLVAVRTVKRRGDDPAKVTAVTMPGFGTTGRTYANAMAMMKALGVTIREISIVKAVEQHFADIGHDAANHDVTYENSQARERTQILMDVANQEGAIVLGTGDLSELALGWATYNGDHMSMYGINAGVPKTLVKYLVEWYAMDTDDAELAAVLNDIVATPISPELIPADEAGNITQKTEDLVGPYELHDFFLYFMLRYGFEPKRVYLMARKAFAGRYEDKVILKWMKTFYRRFFQQQFKRSCMPDGPKVGSVSLSPRGDWRMPSDASAKIWLSDLEF